jgi:hypothetical protein
MFRSFILISFVLSDFFWACFLPDEDMMRDTPSTWKSRLFGPLRHGRSDVGAPPGQREQTTEKYQQERALQRACARFFRAGPVAKAAHRSSKTPR